MIALPPLLAGAVQLRTTCDVPAVVVTALGTPGIVYGVAVAVPLAVPAPTVFTAATRNEYKVAFVNPVTVYRTAWFPVVAVAVVQVVPASLLYSTL